MRTPSPGGRRGSARGAGGGASGPFKPFRVAPRAAAGDGATRGPSRRRRRGAPGRCVRGPFLPQTSRDHLRRRRCWGLRAPRRAGGGPGWAYRVNPPLSRGAGAQVAACAPLILRPSPDPLAGFSWRDPLRVVLTPAPLPARDPQAREGGSLSRA